MRPHTSAAGEILKVQAAVAGGEVDFWRHPALCRCAGGRFGGTGSPAWPSPGCLPPTIHRPITTSILVISKRHLYQSTHRPLFIRDRPTKQRQAPCVCGPPKAGRLAEGGLDSLSRDVFGHGDVCSRHFSTHRKPTNHLKRAMSGASQSNSRVSSPYEMPFPPNCFCPPLHTVWAC